MTLFYYKVSIQCFFAQIFFGGVQTPTVELLWWDGTVFFPIFVATVMVFENLLATSKFRKNSKRCCT